LTLCALGLVGGCAQPQWAEPPKKPTPGAELMKLSRLLGTWSGTAEIVSPSPEEMKAAMPEDAEEMPSSFAWAGKAEWTLGGMFLTSEGWHEMGEGERMNYVEYWTWDPKAKKYRTWYFSDWGESGQGWAWFDAADGDTMRFKATGIDAQGGTKRGKGMMTFTDDDTYEWTWSESGSDGKMKFEGTAKRQ
ncbi:MAG: hypothetical protein WBE26_00920, partial [Phycisphaerae bacterium]